MTATSKRRLSVLVTRPRAEAEIFAVTLAMRGYDALMAPLLDIILENDAPVNLEDAQAVLFTSANGVRAFIRAEKRRDMAVFCVGPATAQAAREAGFMSISTAAGDVDALAALVIATLSPGDGALVHAAGSVVAGDLAGKLASAGFDVRKLQLYRAEEATHLPFEAVAALRDGRVDVVTFFSPRTAEIFAKLLSEADLHDAGARLTALALAPSGLAAAHAAGCRFAHEVAASDPTEAALLDALDKIAETPMADSPAKPDAAAAGDVPPPAAPQVQKQPPPKQPRPKQPRRVVALIATALAAALAGAMGWAYWQSTLTGPAPTNASAALARASDQRLAALERRLAVLESRPTPSAAMDAPQPVDLGEISTRLAALEDRPQVDQALQATLAGLMSENRRLAGELARVQAEIDRLQGGIVEQNNDRASVRRADYRLAVGQLREAVMAGRGFIGELALVRELAGEGRAGEGRAGEGRALGDLAALERFAERGLETQASLARRFAPLANAMVAAARSADVPGRWGEMLERVQTMFSIRRVGDVPGDSPAARIARAETRLAAGDLAGALAAFDGVTGAPWTAPARDWLENARARLGAERAVAALGAAAGG